MEYKIFRRHLGRAGLTNKEFASLVGLNSKSIANYSKTNNVPSHWAIAAVLMGEIVSNNIDLKNLLSNVSIEPNKVRGAAAKGRWGGSKQSDLPI